MHAMKHAGRMEVSALEEGEWSALPQQGITDSH